jgi:sulfur carrier protein
MECQMRGNLLGYAIMALTINVNGQNRVFDGLASPATLMEVVTAMSLKADRIAIEHNGEIAPRARWVAVRISSGDNLEVVHFVGGGTFDEGGPGWSSGSLDCGVEAEKRASR